MSNEVWDYKGWFWDDVNKRMYRWYELELLMKERELKKQQDKKDAENLAKEKINHIKKKTSIGNSRLSNGAGTNKNKKQKEYKGQGK
jgi:hypothetical protein